LGRQPERNQLAAVAAAADRDDDFVVFLPSLRRTRVLAGSDAQDPLAAGLEVSWDEWRAYWQKTDVKNFDYKLVGDSLRLAGADTGMLKSPYELTEDRCGYKWIEMELRPTWILEQTDKSGKYQYSKRVNYVDKELYYTQYSQMYDVRGNLWRVWEDFRNWDPRTGIAQWNSVVVPNVINKRASFVYMETSPETAKTGTLPARFDIDQLRDYR